MLRDFRAFLMKGNVLDLSIAVILGTAFDAIVTALSVAPTTKDRAYRYTTAIPIPASRWPN